MRLLPVLICVVALTALAGCAEPVAQTAAPPGAQRTACAEDLAPAGYDGPCYYGALPAFFDDFAYTSAQTTGPVGEAPRSDLFAVNAWATREGTERTRAWYRFNRGDLAIPGRVTFEPGTVMRLEFSTGLRAEDIARSAVLFAGFELESGTYQWRVRLSELGERQRTRHALWAMSPDTYVFERGGADPIRYTYWSELDFENERHEQDKGFVSWMNVGNHYGKVETPERTRRLSREGPVRRWWAGRSVLAKTGSEAGPAAEAPLARTWAERWLRLIMEVDPEARTVTYRMLPEDLQGSLRAVAERAFSSGPAFYPGDAVAPAVSLHWLSPEGQLEEALWLEVDWLYYTPLPVTDAETERQVAHLRGQDLHRVNTTGRPTFTDHDRPLQVRIEGPAEVACGEAATWRVGTSRAGTYAATYRYRVLDAGGEVGPWYEALAPDLTLTPERGQRALLLAAEIQDRWRPSGRRIGPHGWAYPENGNERATARRTIAVRCGS